MQEQGPAGALYRAPAFQEGGGGQQQIPSGSGQWAVDLLQQPPPGDVVSQQYALGEQLTGGDGPRR